MVEEDTEFITFDGDTISKSDFRDEIINKYIEANIDGMTKITDFTIGSEAYHLADVMASFILEHRELIDLNYRMSMIHTAQGEFLDNFGDMVGVHRKGASPSVGEVTFTRLGTSTTNPIDIYDGTQVSTDDAISFIVDLDGAEKVTIPTSATQVSANVICEQEGAYTNVDPNTIVLVMGELGSLVSVSNSLKFTEGEDIESDDDYRARILLSPYEVPCGTLAWYENVALTLSSVHDVLVEKGETVIDADVNIVFNPKDWTSTVTRLDINDWNEDNDIESTVTGVMTKARADLVDLFNMKEYDMVGITLKYILAEKEPVLVSDTTDTYLFALLLDTDYTLSMVKQDVIDKITSYNGEMNIGVEFSPTTLASIIENEIDGVITCRIVKETSGSYTEMVEPISVESHELAQVDLTDISDRVVKLAFNIDVEVEE